MTDPLGQSQVIPYLEGLTRQGFEFHLLSCEKPERLSSEFNQISEKLQQAKIHWHPIRYTSRPPVISTLIDIRRPCWRGIVFPVSYKKQKACHPGRPSLFYTAPYSRVTVFPVFNQ
jgi:hypothetical protein